MNAENISKHTCIIDCVTDCVLLHENVDLAAILSVKTKPSWLKELICL